MIVESDRRVVAKAFLLGAKQDRDWQGEWNGLVELNERNLPAPRPICVAYDETEGVIWVVMEFIENALTLEAAFESSTAEGTREITQGLVSCLSKMHEAGVRQMDQHIANWAYDGSEIYLLDAATMAFQEDALNTQIRLQDVSAICVTLPVSAEANFVTALSEHYGREETVNQILGSLAKEMSDYQISRLQRYQKKTLRECTEFGVHEGATSKGLFSKAADSDLVTAFFADPDSMMTSGQRLKSGNTCTVQGFEWAGREYVLKRYNAKSRLYRIRHALSTSRALLSWSTGWVLHLAFIPTAKPVAVIDVCENGCRYLLTERIEGTLLPEYLEKVDGDADAIENVCLQLRSICERLERMRGVHGDFKATNWIVGSDGNLHLFDLDVFRFGLSPEAFERGHKKDLERLLENWESSAPIRQALSKMQIAS
ncbi:MAG: hypothetical protein ACSHX8_11920 [Opitutaceae bacterium]